MEQRGTASGCGTLRAPITCGSPSKVVYRSTRAPVNEDMDLLCFR